MKITEVRVPAVGKVKIMRLQKNENLTNKDRREIPRRTEIKGCNLLYKKNKHRGTQDKYNIQGMIFDDHDSLDSTMKTCLYITILGIQIRFLERTSA